MVDFPEAPVGFLDDYEYTRFRHEGYDIRKYTVLDSETHPTVRKIVEVKVTYAIPDTEDVTLTTQTLRRNGTVKNTRVDQTTRPKTEFNSKKPEQWVKDIKKNLKKVVT